MARSSFSGGGSFDSLFSSLYTSTHDNAKARQQAADADALDQWNNGLMDDATWQAYIASRIASTTGDPAEHQQWITAQRKYAVAISDNKAESAYKEGGSINELIGYYQSRLGGLSADTNEYRSIQLKVNDLMDQRASDNVQTGAQKIIDEINKGTKGYKDLLAFMQAARGTTRANSSLRDSLDKQLQQVKDQIRSDAVEGSIEKLQYEYDKGSLSAGSYAAAIRKEAKQFQQSDPKRYYQMLEAAVSLGHGGGRSGGGGGGGGGGRGGGSALSAAARKAVSATIDSVQAQRNNLQSLAQQFEDNNGRMGSSGYDPATGKAIVFTTDFVHKMDSSLLSTFDKLSAAYKSKKDYSAAANAQKAKGSYLSKHVVLHNTMKADDQSRELMVSSNAVLSAADEDPDPQHALALMQQVAGQWRSFADNLTKVHGVVQAGPHENRQGYVGAKPQAQSVDTDFAARANGFATALETLTDPSTTDPTEALAQLAALDGQGGGQYGGNLKAGPMASMGQIIAGAIAVREGLKAQPLPTVARVIQNGKITFVKTVAVTHQGYDGGQAMPVTVAQPLLEFDSKTSKIVDVFVDINGVPVKVQAVAVNKAVAGLQQWVAARNLTLPDGTQIAKGKPVPDSVFNGTKLSKADLQSAIDHGSFESADAFKSLQVEVPSYTDSNGVQHAGSIWVQDPGTMLWYKDVLPIRNAQLDATGHVKLDENGRPMIDWNAYASEGGVPAPYAGNDPKAMQALLDGGKPAGPDVSGVRGRDMLGNLSLDGPDMHQSYYSPAEAGITTPDPGHDNWWNDQQRTQRSTTKLDLVRQQERDAVDLAAKTGGGQRSLDRSQSDVPGPTPTLNADSIVSSIQDFAKLLGVNIGGTKPREPALPLRSAQPRNLDLPDVPTAGKTYSGPAATLKLNLPAKHAGPIVMPRTRNTDRAQADVVQPKAVPPAVKPKPKPAPKPTVVLDQTTAARTGTSRAI